MKYSDDPTTIILHHAIAQLLYILSVDGLSITKDQNFNLYKDVRELHGEKHLNQAFDSDFAEFGPHDFCLFASNESGEPVATYCSRRFVTADFFELIRSQKLWFAKQPHTGRQALALECEEPVIVGEVAHGGGLWVRPDYRGLSRLAFVLPRLARALSLIERPFDHDTGMIRADVSDGEKLARRKALFAGIRLYGFARTIRLVNGWFSPDAQPAIIHLCHANRSEVLGSLMNGIPARVRQQALFASAGRLTINLDGRQLPIFKEFEMNGGSPAVD